MRQLTQDYPLVRLAIVNVVVRLEAQKYTLALWNSIWTRKALRGSDGSIEVNLQELWGEDGYTTILECLGQVLVKFGEASRALKTIDTESLGARAHSTQQPSLSPSSSSSNVLATASRALALGPSSSLRAPDPPSRSGSKNKKKRW